MANVKTTLVQFQNTAFPGNASVWRWPLATTFGGFAVSVSQFNTMRPAGVYSNLRARVVTNTNNNTSTLRFNNNGANSNLVIAIGTTQTGSFEDIVNTDTVINGGAGYMHLTVPAGSTGSITFSLTQIDFLATSDTHTTLAAHGSAVISNTGTTCFNQITATIVSTVTTESSVQTQFKHSCTLKNFRIRVTVDSRTGNTTHRIRVNGANGNQSLTTSATGVFEDVTNTDTIVNGDKICFSTTTDATAGGSHTWTNMGFDVENTTNSIYPLPATGGGATQNFGLTRYECPSLLAATATEANTQVKLYQPKTLKNLGANLFTNTINGTTTVRMRKNASDVNPVVTIGSSTTGFFSDDASTTDTAANDLINFSVVTGGSSGNLSYGSLYVEAEALIQNYTGDINETTVIVGTDTINRLLILPRPIVETAITVGAGSVSRIQQKVKTISETAITIGGGSVTRLQILTRAIAEGAITVGGGSVSRLQQIFRTISETAITVGAGSVAIAKQFARTISETAVTVGADSVIRLQLLMRAISEGTITVGAGSVSLFQSLIRTVAEPAISVGAGTVQAGKLLTAQVTETLTKWYYSVVTRKIGGG